MKYFFLIILFLGVQHAHAFKVDCTCEEPCQTVSFKISKTRYGTRMTVDTLVNQLRGMATVSESKIDDEVTYQMDQYILIKSGHNFEFFGSGRSCKASTYSK